jgi:hypothetical protein
MAGPDRFIGNINDTTFAQTPTRTVRKREVVGAGKVSGTEHGRIRGRQKLAHFSSGGLSARSGPFIDAARAENIVSKRVHKCIIVHDETTGDGRVFHD